MELQNPKSGILWERLMSNVLFERKLVKNLIDIGFTKEVGIEIGKTFNGKNLKNMSLITVVTDPSKDMDKNVVSSRIIPIEDYPIFTKEDPQELLESYIADCLATCVLPVAYSFDKLLETTSDVYSLKRKRKSKSTCDGPSGTIKPPTKMARTSNILRNTMAPKSEDVGSGTEVPTAQQRPLSIMIILSTLLHLLLSDLLQYLVYPL